MTDLKPPEVFNEKLNEMAEAYSISKCDTILEELAIEEHFKAGFKAALSLPEVKAMEEALENIKIATPHTDQIWTIANDALQQADEKVRGE